MGIVTGMNAHLGGKLSRCLTDTTTLGHDPTICRDGSFSGAAEKQHVLGETEDLSRDGVVAKG